MDGSIVTPCGIANDKQKELAVRRKVAQNGVAKPIRPVAF